MRLRRLLLPARRTADTTPTPRERIAELEALLAARDVEVRALTARLLQATQLADGYTMLRDYWRGRAMKLERAAAEHVCVPDRRTQPPRTGVVCGSARVTPIPAARVGV